MGKLLKIVILVAIIAVAAYVVVTMSANSGGSRTADSKQRDDRPRLEEKYGFTSETAGD
jgi:flagellar basal body-associated protein FliL